MDPSLSARLSNATFLLGLPEPAARFLEIDLEAAVELCRARAAELNIRVINMLLGGRGDVGQALDIALNRARQDGLLLVASAGNELRRGARRSGAPPAPRPGSPAAPALPPPAAP